MYYTLSKVGSVYRMINSELLAKHSQGNMALNIAKFIHTGEFICIEKTLTFKLKLTYVLGNSSLKQTMNKLKPHK